MKNVFTVFFVIAYSIFVITDVFAQGVTTTSIAGNVSDLNGPVIGATIVATHTTSGTNYGGISSIDGNFLIKGMRVGGPYTISFSYIGYQTQTITDVNLSLGQELSFDIKMKEDAQNIGEVVVTAQRFAGVRPTKSGMGVNIGNQAIQVMPTVSRSISDITRLMPQAGSQGMMGKGAKSNNLTVDGASFNNFMGLGGEATGSIPGGNAGAQPFSLDAFDQIAVMASPYDVSVGGFTGAGINIVTKSGDNTFRASVYDYYRNQSFIGKKIGDATLTIPSFVENTIGFRVGGPIVKDKLFFFANFETIKNTTPITNIAAKRAGLEGANVSNIDATTMDALSDYLANTYSYHAGGYEGIQKLNQSYKFLVKLDWNINNKNKFSIRYNQLTAKSLNGNTGPNISTLNFASRLYNRNNEIYGISAELNSELSAKLSNRFIASYTSIPDYRSPYIDHIFPAVKITHNGNTISFGTDGAAYQNRVDQKIFQIQDDITYLLGKNKFTAGFNWQYMNLSNNFTNNPQGTFDFATLADFYNSSPVGTTTPIGPSTGAGLPRQYSLNYTVQPNRTVTLSNPKVSQLGLYLQDEVAFSSRFTLQAGMRFDIISMIGTPKENPNVPAMNFQWANGSEFNWSTNKTAGTKVLFSPRVGINWAVDESRKLTIKSGIGMFTGVIPFTFFDKIYSMNGMNEGSINTTANMQNYPFSPENAKYKPTSATVPPPSYELDFVDDNFKMPQTLRASLGFEYELPGRVLVGLEGVYSKDYNSPYYENVNLNQKTAIKNDAAGGRLQYASRQINPAVTGAYMLRAKNMGYQKFLTATIKKAFYKGPNVSMSYTYGDSQSPYEFLSTTAAGAFNSIQVVGNPNIPVLAYSTFDLRHRLVLDVNYRIRYGNDRWATTIGMFFNAAQQGRSSYVYGGTGDVNKDGVAANDLIYVPKTLSEINIVANGAISIQDQWTALDNYISSSPYLNSRRGQFAERNGLINPWYAQLDLHFGQEFTFNKKRAQKVEFTLDIMNFSNMINKNWGIIKVAANNAPITATSTGTFTVNPDNLKRGEFIPQTDISSAWSMMFGIRFSFN